MDRSIALIINPLALHGKLGQNSGQGFIGAVVIIFDLKDEPRLLV
jgi:hypothetical protein